MLLFLRSVCCVARQRKYRRGLTRIGGGETLATIAVFFFFIPRPGTCRYSCPLELMVVTVAAAVAADAVVGGVVAADGGSGAIKL